MGRTEEGSPIRTRPQLFEIVRLGRLRQGCTVAVATLLWTAVPGAEERVADQSVQDPADSEPVSAGVGARLRLVAGASGSGLAFVDALGRPRVLLGTTKHGPGLAVCDPAGAARGWLGFQGGGIGFGLWDPRELPQTAVVLSVTAARFAVHGEQGAPRTALVVTGGHRYAAAFFAQHGKLRAATALGDLLPVLARFDLRGKIVREPFHHVLPGLFADAVKASLGFLARIGRDKEPSEVGATDMQGQGGA